MFFEYLLVYKDFFAIVCVAINALTLYQAPYLETFQVLVSVLSTVDDTKLVTKVGLFLSLSMLL